MQATARELTADDQHLAKLGYKQELNRSWSGFSNFAISFSIISILAGCLTTYGAGIANGGPVSISWSWPIISAFILIIGFTMSELVVVDADLGRHLLLGLQARRARAGFFTGWLNLIGLVAVTASVAYGCATFFELTFDVWGWFDSVLAEPRLHLLPGDPGGHRRDQHLLQPPAGGDQQHLGAGGTSPVRRSCVLVLIFVPDDHLSFQQVFTDRFNGSGWDGGSTGSLTYLFIIIPFGFILTQYTITGFDASVHLSEETQGAARSAARGIWQSIFYSAVGGYILLLAVTFAIPKVERRTRLREHPGRRRGLRLRRGAGRQVGGAAAVHLRVPRSCSARPRA